MARSVQCALELQSVVLETPSEVRYTRIQVNFALKILTNFETSVLQRLYSDSCLLDFFRGYHKFRHFECHTAEANDVIHENLLSLLW